MMKQLKLRKIVSLLLIAAMVILGSIEPKAATGSQVFLYGLHSSLPEQIGHGNHCSWMKRVDENMFKRHDPTATVTRRHHSGAKNLYDRMKIANYLMVVTHGNKTCIAGYSSNGVTSYLTVDDIKKGARLNQLKVCLLAACQAYTVAKAMNEMGARTTIGYTNNVRVDACRKVQLYFNKYFTSGQKVVNAIYNAYISTVGDLKEDCGMISYVVYGDLDQTF